jgi:Cytochrome c
VKRIGYAACIALALAQMSVGVHDADQSPASSAAPSVPKTWDDQEMATLEIPLANPTGSPKHAPSSYYYSIPVRPIYKSYPVYAFKHEPQGYIESLKQREPEIIWDDRSHRPQLKTPGDWIAAGELVFDSPTSYGGVGGSDAKDLYVREAKFLSDTDTPVGRDGTLPFFRYVVKKKGEVEIGALACGMCHSRVMPDGAILKGAQGNFPFDRVMAADYLHAGTSLDNVRALERSLYATPWLGSDSLPATDRMSLDEIVQAHRSVPPGVVARHRTSPFAPAQVPDLIGVKDRKYLDRTGLQQQRSIVDLMRYAALNQGGDDLASFDGFIPADFANFKKLPAADTQDRYSDEQLYALAQFIYAQQPPPNPNKFDALAAHGKEVFESENCVMCHTPPLYTSNKLTPAVGFSVPPDARKKYDILPMSVGTDPNLTMKTRRGTGYYKVPSLKGVWYRGMFGHDGWCATLEDWFNPRRASDDYVPTGFKPYGARTFAVKGHPFGLDLSDEDRKALIAFLRTL